jgi:transposase
MAKTYSNDLRRKLLEAHDRGEGSLRELAERFGVSSPYAWKISAQRKRTGQVERTEQRHGPESKVTAVVEQQLQSWVRQQPDLTLAEMQERLWKTMRLPVSLARLWQVLRRLQLRLKKIAPCPGTGHPGKSAAAGGVVGSTERNRSGPAGVFG